MSKLVLTADKLNIDHHELLERAINFIFEAIENDYIFLANFDPTLTELAKKLEKDKTDLIIDALNYYENAVKEWECKNKP